MEKMSRPWRLRDDPEVPNIANLDMVYLNTPIGSDEFVGTWLEDKLENIGEEELKKFLELESPKEVKDREREKIRRKKDKDKDKKIENQDNKEQKTMVANNGKEQADQKEGGLWICRIKDKETQNECGESFETLRGLRVHQNRTHRAVHYLRCRILTNQCC